MRTTFSFASRPASPAIVGIGLALVGALLCGTAVVWARSERQLVREGARTMGKVVALERKEGSYFPVFRFRDTKGRVVDVRSSSSSRSYMTGDSVPVIYDPSRPLRASIDNGWMMFFGPVILGGMGVVFLCVGSTVWIFRQRFDSDGEWVFGRREARHPAG